MTARYRLPRSPLAVVAILGLIALAPARAQSSSGSDVNVSLGGILQAESGYGWITGPTAASGRDRIGFGLRRTRLLVTANLGPQFGAFFHLDADGGVFGVLDAFLSYSPNPRVRFRLGRMASAQPRAFILTPVIAMDATERAAIALLWHGGTLGSKGRDFGIDVRILGRGVEAIVFVHNGDGSFERFRSNYQQNIVGDVTEGISRGLDRMAISTFLAWRPPNASGIEVGGFVGRNGNRNPSTAIDGLGRVYTSYAVHAYWGAEPGSQPFRLKADAIGVHYEETADVLAQQTLGLSILAAVAVHEAAELFGRFEAHDPNLDTAAGRNFYLTTGTSFSPSRLRGRPYSQERVTLGYGVRIPEEDSEAVHHLLILQVQLKF